jgi:hypothetical protein
MRHGSERSSAFRCVVHGDTRSFVLIWSMDGRAPRMRAVGLWRDGASPAELIPVKQVSPTLAGAGCHMVSEDERASPARYLFRTVLKIWCFVSGDRGRRPKGIPEVVIHDPEAQGPRNLDDPFLDPRAQARVGDLIGRAARLSERTKPYTDSR